jgi:hypothetical protein
MQQCQAAIAKQQAFTLHLLRSRPSSLKTRRLVIAHFKSAATEHLNSAAPLVGVPGQVQWKSGEDGHLYFVTVQKDEPDVRYEQKEMTAASGVTISVLAHVSACLLLLLVSFPRRVVLMPMLG